MSSWAAPHVERLVAGQTVSFRPRGHSMRGRIDSGQLVTVAPLEQAPEVGDAVLCKVRGRHFLHLVKSVRGVGPGREYKIGNNRGGVNGWVRRSSIYGLVTEVED